MNYPLPLPAEWPQLLAAGDLRLLRRVPPVERWELSPASGDVVRAAIVDTETTGLGDDDEVIELAIVPFDYERETGRICCVWPPFVGLRQPSKPIPQESTKVHGITNEMVAGKSFFNADVAWALEGVNLVIAYNAVFDRPMCERLVDERLCESAFRRLPWACSCDEIDWKGMGFGSRSLEHLLLKQGWFFDGHRAADDALATLFLLTLDLPTGEPALAALLANARKPQYVVRVGGSKIDERSLLKERDYAWDASSKTWWKATVDLHAEDEWWRSVKDTLMGTMHARRVSPVDRYSKRVEAT